MSDKKPAIPEPAVEQQPISLQMEKDMIDSFLEDCIGAAKRASIAYRTVEQGKRVPALQQSINYWKNVKAGLKWARSLNQQRRK